MLKSPGKTVQLALTHPKSPTLISPGRGAVAQDDAPVPRPKDVECHRISPHGDCGIPFFNAGTYI